MKSMTERTDPPSPVGPRLAYSANEYRRSLCEATDRELLAALRGGDELALDELIDRKTNALLAVAYRILNDSEEARDIVQVTFLRLWEKRQQYDERWSPNTWIYRIATNLSIDHLRSRQSRQRYKEPIRLHLRDLASGQERHDLANLDESEVMGIFRELAEELTEKQRTVFVLREIEDLPSKEVAAIVGCRESTVRNHLFNARKFLRGALLERYPEYARAYTREAKS
jgi:RNA polymerase sigma-70 factor (ECF subfamily)